MKIVVHEPELQPSIRELFSRRPETYYREPWELQSLLYLLNYTAGLIPEADIAAAVEVARTDLNPDVGAA